MDEEGFDEEEKKGIFFGKIGLNTMGRKKESKKNLERKKRHDEP